MTAKNISASVHARLQNQARATKRPFQELLQYFAMEQMERFLYRLSKTPHRTRFVLKGALMLRVWDAPLGALSAIPSTLASTRLSSSAYGRRSE